MSERKSTTIISVDETKPPKSIPIAPTWRRIAAFLVDSFLLNLVYSFVFYLSRRQLIVGYLNTNPPMDVTSMRKFQEFLLTLYQEAFLLYALFEIILWSSYFILFWKAYGQTLGAKIFNIEILPGTPESSSPENPFLPSWGACVIRFVLLYGGVQLYGFPFLFVINPRFNQRFHDFFSRTFVVFIPRDKDEDNKTHPKTTKRSLP